MFKKFDELKYFENDDAQLALLPYDDKNLELFVLLPKEVYGTHFAGYGG